MKKTILIASLLFSSLYGYAQTKSYHYEVIYSFETDYHKGMGEMNIYSKEKKFTAADAVRVIINCADIYGCVKAHDIVVHQKTYIGEVTIKTKQCNPTKPPCANH